MASKTQLSIKNFNTDFECKRNCGKYKVYFRSIENAISLQTPVFRYMKFSHLLTLLNTSTLYISNRKSFSDLCDKFGVRKFVPTKKEPFKIEPEVSRSDRVHQREIDRCTQKALDLCVSCWTMDQISNSGEVCENFLMWKAYQTSDLMCRIGTTIENLINNIESPYDVLISNVSYENRGALTADRITFNKSKCYRDEKEVRLVPLISGQSFVQLRIINIEEWLESITLSPFVTPQIENMLNAYMLKTYPWTKTKIKISSIMEY